jgi:hypothetical protein
MSPLISKVSSGVTFEIVIAIVTAGDTGISTYRDAEKFTREIELRLDV